MTLGDLTEYEPFVDVLTHVWTQEEDDELGRETGKYDPPIPAYWAAFAVELSDPLIALSYL